MIAVVWIGLIDALHTATQPVFGECQRLLRIVEVRITRATFVESHDDIRTDDTLDIHHTLGGEEMLRAVDVRAEGHPFLRDLTAMRQAEDLIASAVGEDRARPAIELMQPACLVQGIEPWAQVEVVCIAEDDLCVDVIAQLGHMDSLHRANRPDGHKDRSKDLPVVGLYTSSARGSLSTSLMDIEFQHRCR